MEKLKKQRISKTKNTVEDSRKQVLKTQRQKSRRKRRRSQGSAWYWQQTNTWYFTKPGTRQRVPLCDDEGRRIRGAEKQTAAEAALAKLRPVKNRAPPTPAVLAQTWTVARVCQSYLAYCAQGVAAATISKAHHSTSQSFLKSLCLVCGNLTLAQLKKHHVRVWTESQPGWKSTSTILGALKIVLAAFNYAQREHDVPNPLRGLKKPRPIARLQSFSAIDEQALLAAALPEHRDLLLAAIQTGLRPFCELAKLTAADIEVTPRGMMWRVYSSKTKKTRKIPVRPEVARLTRRLIKSAPRDSSLPLFRTPRQRTWQKCNGVLTFIALRKRLGWDRDPLKRKYTTYTCRHTFAHRMLSGYWNQGQGCSIEVLAELLGDTPQVAFDHYGKEWGQYYQEPLWNALGVADLSPVHGPTLGPFAQRSEALAAEVAWLQRHWLEHPAQP